MDNDVFGSGTKLPHNVMGLVGVSIGVDGDLLTGLPLQMVEVHEPVRLLVLVEQEPEIALRAAQKNPDVYQWIENGWVQYVAFSPTSRQSYHFSHGQMLPLDTSQIMELPTNHEVAMCYQKRSGYVPFARVVSHD